MRRQRSSASIAVVLVLLVVLWQVYIWVKHIPPYVLPAPWETAKAVGSNLSLLLHRSWATAEGALVGLGAAIAVALILGIAILRFPSVEHVILTYAVLVRTLPIVGVAPIVTLAVGRGPMTSVLCVMVMTVFSLLIAVTQGFASVPPEIGELSDLYAAPFRRRFRIALLPGAMASLLQGLRVAAPLAVLGALLAEWLDGFPGIGSLMILAQANQEVELLMAACMTAVALSLTAFALAEVANTLSVRRGYQG